MHERKLMWVLVVPYSLQVGLRVGVYVRMQNQSESLLGQTVSPECRKQNKRPQATYVDNRISTTTDRHHKQVKEKVEHEGNTNA